MNTELDYEAIRNEFEQWAKENGFNTDTNEYGMYTRTDTFYAWAGWKAGIAHQTQSEAEPADTQTHDLFGLEAEYPMLFKAQTINVYQMFKPSTEE